MKLLSNFTTKQITLSAIFLALIIIGGFLKIPIGIVPITLQLLFVLLTAQLLTPKSTIFVIFTYVILGLIGLPVFSNGGGIGYVLQPTFGYLIGFLFGGVLTSFLVHRKIKVSVKYMLFANFCGYLCVYIFGVLYFYLLNIFYFSNNVMFGKTLLTCFVVFVPSDIVFCLLSAFIADKIKPFVVC